MEQSEPSNRQQGLHWQSSWKGILVVPWDKQRQPVQVLVPWAREEEKKSLQIDVAEPMEGQKQQTKGQV